MPKNKWTVGMLLGGMAVFLLVSIGYAEETPTPTGLYVESSALALADADAAPPVLPQAMVIANLVMNTPPPAPPAPPIKGKEAPSDIDIEAIVIIALSGPSSPFDMPLFPGLPPGPSHPGPEMIPPPEPPPMDAAPVPNGVNPPPMPTGGTPPGDMGTPPPPPIEEEEPPPPPPAEETSLMPIAPAIVTAPVAMAEGMDLPEDAVDEIDVTIPDDELGLPVLFEEDCGPEVEGPLMPVPDPIGDTDIQIADTLTTEEIITLMEGAGEIG